MEEHFSLLHASYFASAEQPQHPGVSVLVVNPDRDAMAAAAGLPARYSYRYRYAGGAPTQMWLGGGRCSLGRCRLPRDLAGELGPLGDRAELVAARDAHLARAVEQARRHPADELVGANAISFATAAAGAVHVVHPPLLESQ